MSVPHKPRHPLDIRSWMCLSMRPKKRGSDAVNKLPSFLPSFLALCFLSLLVAFPGAVLVSAQSCFPSSSCTGFVDEGDFSSPGFRSKGEQACTLGLLPACGASADEVFFCPGEPVTREDMAVSLERLYRGSNYNPPAASGVFADVPKSYCLARWIEQLRADQITSGCATNPPRYCPFQPVTRWQMAVFLSKVIADKCGEQVPASGTINGQPFNCTAGGVSLFADIAPSDGGCKYVHYIYAKGITSGCATNPLRYCPSTIISREQMAVFLVGAHDEVASCSGQ
ncbi:hypothetical protein HRbin09_00134 [bacterium HR09]|nr:hypothetical protein HRbin09_00134 [bacterium HR09]